MNEESIYLKAESKPKRKIETKQDVQLIQQELQEKKEQLIDDAPKISLSIKNAEFCLNILFNEDGTPKGDFRVSERYQKKVCISFKHPHKKFTTGEMYWGNLSNKNEYLIQATPTFLTDEELYSLQIHHRLTKKINNVDIEFVPPFLQKDNYSERIETYRKNIEPSRRKIQEISSIISELESLKTKLPWGPREVIIEPNNEVEDSSGYPRN